jgi:hypothetical protein
MKRMHAKVFVALGLVLGLASAARAHDAPTAPARVAEGAGAPRRALDDRGVDASPAPATIRWRVRHVPVRGKAQGQAWELRRSDARIVWSKGDDFDEVWHRDASGISLWRVMHRHRHVIEYSAGELRTLGVEAHWPALGTLFDERALTLLRPDGPARGDGSRRYRGKLEGDRVDVVWDHRTRAPIRLTQSNARGRVEFERVSVRAGADAEAWPGEARIADYARIDAADFGDLEHDPVVRLAMTHDERLGWRRRHHH